MGDTSKIHFHKGMFGTLTVDMNGLGYQFLTCPAFPCNENRGIGLCYAGNRIQHIHQSLATPDDVAAVERIALFLRWFLWSARKLECRFDALQQGSIIPGLRYEIKKSPACIPCTASWILPQAVINITGVSGRNIFTCLSRVKPSSPL